MEQKSNSYVYILCNRHRTVLYVGATDDLKKRIYFHKKGLLPGFTKRYNVNRLVYYERHGNTSVAKLREKQLKGYRRSKKESIISNTNPGWNDLWKNISS